MLKLILGAILACGLGLFYLYKQKADSRGQLKSFSYNWSDPNKTDCEEVFEAVADGTEFVKLRIKCYDEEGNQFYHTGKVRREAFMAGLEQLSKDRRLDKWNGFAQSNPKQTGNVFTFEAGYSDGSRIFARGNNSVPNGYGPAVKDIKAYFKANCK